MSTGMTGRTVLITGANTGIGLETAVALADMGANVVITSRDPAKGSAAVEAIKERSPGSEACALDLDLSRLSHVRGFAHAFTERFDALHVLVNNAGLMQSRRSVTEDGFETTFQVNHLGPFLLTNLLLDNLKRSAPARIVNVASTAHRGNRIDFDDLHSERGYVGMRVYGISKLCNILFTRELAKRLDGTGVTANSLHPGTVRTGFGRDGDAGFLLGLGIILASPFFLSPAGGAKTTIYLASSPEVEGRTGEYWVRRRSMSPSRQAQDDEAARRLWEISEELVGLAAPERP